MSLEVKQTGEGLTLAISGEVDHHAAKALMAQLEAALSHQTGRQVTLDLSGVSFMDSSGIAVLLRLYRRVNEVGGTVTVRGTPAQAGKVLRAAGLQKLMCFE